MEWEEDLADFIADEDERRRGESTVIGRPAGETLDSMVLGSAELDDDELLQLAVQQLPESQALTIEPVASGHARLHDESQPDFDEEAAQLLAEEEDANGDIVDEQGEEEESYVAPSRSALDIPGICFPVTGTDGQRVYCHLRDDETGVRKPVPGGHRASHLLGRPISRLMEEVESARLAAALSRSEAETSNSLKKTGNKRKQKRKLWVDKHAPSSFMDLLSAEIINRDVVRWLKCWDRCVFGRESLSTEPTDQLGRPEHRIVLLAGPPGLGKTTLAHIAAKHCGYRPMEVNASDERGARALTARVTAATASHSVTADRRPVCLILDEIDGAAGGAEGKGTIAALVRLVQAPPLVRKKEEKKGGGAETERTGSHEDESGSEDEDDDQRRENTDATKGGLGRRRKGLSEGPLLRPIIAICNDLYAPALRPLRDIARVFHFRKPTSERIGQKLAQICEAEGLHVEKSTLRTLAEMAECDVRCCLNTLQFLARKKSSVCLEDLKGLSLGQKDINRNAFAVWQDLLQARAPAGRPSERPQVRTMRLISFLQDYGEHALIASGLFENLPNLRFFDIACGRTAKALEGLADVDVFLRRGGSWALPALLVSTSSCLTSHERPALSWPKDLPASVRQTASQRALVQLWRKSMTGISATCYSPTALLLDVLPWLDRASAPPVRPVHPSLYTPEESVALDRCVGVLLGFGLRPAAASEQDENSANFTGRTGLQRRTATDQLSHQSGPPLHFQPPVHSLVRFAGFASPVIGGCHPATLQILQQALDTEIICRNDASRQGGPSQRSQHAHIGACSSVKKHGHPAVPLTLAERLQNAAGIPSKKPPCNGGAVKRSGTWLEALRTAKREKAGRRNDGAKDTTDAPDTVLYLYHEGYTNAVRRPVIMADLLYTADHEGEADCSVSR